MRARIPPVRIEFSAEDRAEILRRIDRALAFGRVAQGDNVAEFEAAFGRYLGARQAVAVGSGGAAIEMAMRLLDVRGRDVLVPTNTFAATALGVLRAGGHLRFVDADAATFSVSLAGLQAAVTGDTAGAIVVHLGGIITPEIEAIRAWCETRGLWLFEDAAHAHGSSLNGTMAGRFGRAAAYSFASTKVVTSGEGGMLVTDDAVLAARARGLRDYGKPDPWVSVHTDIGANWRMSEFCAAVGLVHLRRLDEFVAGREKIAGFYSTALDGIPGSIPIVPSGRSSWYKYVVLLAPEVDRDRVKRAMQARGIGLPGGVYETPLHRQPIFSPWTARCPVADDICRRHICLPLYAGMTEDEAAEVVAALRTALGACRNTPHPSAGFAGAILSLGEASEGAVEAPSELPGEQGLPA